MCIIVICIVSDFDIELIGDFVMAIYGFGSTWGDDGEQKGNFFDEEKIIVGWNKESADDLYSMISSIKTGDIIYLKGNRPGSREITVKGIGIVTKNFIDCVISDNNAKDIKNWSELYLKIKWIVKESFKINIPSKSGKLTNIRAATMYEEYLPFVQQEILNKIFYHIR